MKHRFFEKEFEKIIGFLNKSLSEKITVSKIWFARRLRTNINYSNSTMKIQTPAAKKLQ